MSREAYFAKVHTFIEHLDHLPDDGPAAQVKMNSVLMLSNELMRVYQTCDMDPIPPLATVLDAQIEILRNTTWPKRQSESPQNPGDKQAVRHLYEQAWTSYDQRTYDHSLKLMEDRLRANGLDESFFKGKRCIDAGCGTGRFAIAMAKLGAASVVGADIGVKSLAFARERAQERGVADRVEFMELDITNLSKFRDQEFDFVASNGVLMCTGKCHAALREHFRVTKQGGLFWIYLYGANGIMWDTYDLLRTAMQGIGPDRAKAHMLAMDTRLGMVYTFLDNVFAPIRTYHGTQEVLDVLASVAPTEARPQRGLSDVDDSVRQTSSPYGALIYGDECEVRQIVTRK
ncbi:MAG TPA: class I SAM-dependent methyltransferase [Kofleriaceae bacterium]